MFIKKNIINKKKIYIFYQYKYNKYNYKSNNLLIYYLIILTYNHLFFFYVFSKFNIIIFNTYLIQSNNLNICKIK